jgi:hypothetical protein
MKLSTPWQRVATLGAVLAALAVGAIAIAWIVSSLGAANQGTLGHWLDQRSAAIWGFLIGAVPSIATYFFGSSKGKSSGKLEAFTSSVSTVRASGNPALADQLVSEAAGHGVSVGT